MQLRMCNRPDLRLLQRLMHQGGRDAADLDVHLQGRDAALGPADLEIHIAQMIFQAQNIGQDHDAILFLDQSHRDAGHRLFDRHTRIHHRQGSTADSRHGRRAVRLQDIGHNAQRVWKLVLCWESPASAHARPTLHDRLPDGPANGAAWLRPR